MLRAVEFHVLVFGVLTVPILVLLSSTNIWDLFSWTQRILRVLVWGRCGTLAKEQGPFGLLSDYGAQRARFDA